MVSLCCLPSQSRNEHGLSPYPRLLVVTLGMRSTCHVYTVSLSRRMLHLIKNGIWKSGPCTRSGGSRIIVSPALDHFQVPATCNQFQLNSKTHSQTYQYVQFICRSVVPTSREYHGYMSATSFIRRAPRLARVTSAVHELTPGRHRGQCRAQRVAKPRA